MPNDSEATAGSRWRIPDWYRRIGIGSWLFLGVVAAIAVLSLLIGLTAAITVPVILGAFLAVIFIPAVDWLENRGLNRSLSALGVLVGLLLLLGVVAYLIVSALVDQADEIVATLDAAIETIKGWLEGTPIDEALADQAQDTTTDTGSSLPGGLVAGALTLGGTVVALIGGSVLGTIVLYYLLKDGAAIASAALDRKSEDDRALYGRVADRAVVDIRDYIKGRTAIALMNGIVIGLAALLLGVPAAASIAVVSFVGAYIPYLGAFIAGAFAVLMALGEGGIGLALVILGVTLAVNLLLESLLEPVLVGGTLDIHPLLVLLATAFGGLIAGLIGLILAAPALAIAIDIKRELKASGFFAEPAPDPD